MSGDTDGLDDDALVELAKGGSSTAFGAIYDRHAQAVARALAPFAGVDHDLLDDLLQEVFLRVIRGLPSYAPTHTFTGWLFTIALNVGRNHVRHRPELVLVDPGDLDDFAGSAGTNEDALIPARLMELVARLPIEMREVVSLRVGSDLPYRAIGELLGIPEGTARSRMHNAMVALRHQSRVSEPNKERRS